MLYKEFTTKNNKSIFIYDDLLGFQERMRLFQFILKSKYNIGGGDNGQDVDIQTRNMFSKWSNEDLIRSKFILHPEIKKLKSKFASDHEIFQTRVNLCSFSDYNNFHTDAEGGFTLLYYANLEWDLRWGGLTLFSDDKVQDLELAVDFKPGRVIVFDSDIPHCVQAPTVMAPQYRYSLAIQFKPRSTS